VSTPAGDLRTLVAKTRQVLRAAAAAHPNAKVRLEVPLRQDANKDPGLLEQGPEDILSEGPQRIPQPPWGEALWSFEEQIRACERCELGRSKKNFVFGEGKKDARLVFVGDAPGADDDRLGRPFMGAAGQLLGRIIQAMGFRREDIYLCNVLKCRPPRNREALSKEAECCLPYLQHQMELVQPEVIVLLGGAAVQMVLGGDVPITERRGTWQSWKGRAVMPTFHPSDLMRDERLKRHVWEDMKLVMKKLENPQP
jgi:DNA polymerase